MTQATVRKMTGGVKTKEPTMSDQFSRTTRAYTGGTDPHISINSVSEAAAHIVGAFAFPLLGPAWSEGPHVAESGSRTA